MLGFLVETIKNRYLGFLGVIDFFLGVEMAWRFLREEKKTLKVFLGLFSFFFILLNKLLFLISLKSRMVLSYSFITYVCENMPIRD